MLTWLENVTALSEKSEEVGAESDTEYIVRFFKERSFFAVPHVVDAEDYSSFQPRSRLFFAVSDEQRLSVNADVLVSFTTTVMAHVKLDVDDFATFEISPRMRSYWSSSVPLGCKSKRSKEGEGWIEKHMEIYHRYNVPWPARVAAIPGTEDLTEALSPRALERFRKTENHRSPG